MADEKKEEGAAPKADDPRDLRIKELEAQLKATDDQIAAMKAEASKGGGKDRRPAASEDTLQALLESNKAIKEELASKKKERRKFVPWSI